MLTERSKVPSEPKKRDFFPAKNPVDARREVVHSLASVKDMYVEMGFPLNLYRQIEHRI